MKGPRELKRLAQTSKDFLKAIHWDSLLVFKLERDRKYRKTNRRPRDGSYGTSAEKPDFE